LWSNTNVNGKGIVFAVVTCELGSYLIFDGFAVLPTVNVLPQRVQSNRGRSQVDISYEFPILKPLLRKGFVFVTEDKELERLTNVEFKKK
jgi:hypothetical protein